MHTFIDKSFKWILFLATIAVFFIHMITSKSLPDFIRLFQYYTIQSNGLVLLLLGLHLSKDYNVMKKRPFMPQLTAVVTSLILITGILFHAFLADLFNPRGLGAISNFLEHTLVPFGMGFYFLFIYKDYFPKLKDIPLFLVYPILYTVVSLIRGYFTGFYPYWFINPVLRYPNGLGSYANLGLFFLGMLVTFTLFSFILIKAYSLIRKRHRS